MLKPIITSATLWTVFLYVMTNIPALGLQVPAEDETGSSQLHQLPRADYGDGYGSAYGLNGMSSAGYGSICNCPAAGLDSLGSFTYLGIGALLGLLSAGLLAGLAAAGGALNNNNINPGAGGGGRGFSNLHMADFLLGMYTSNHSWIDSLRLNPSRTPVESLTGPFQAIKSINNLVKNAYEVWTEGQKKPQCLNQLICRFTLKSLKNKGLMGRLAPLAGTILSWTLSPHNISETSSVVQLMDELRVDSPLSQCRSNGRIRKQHPQFWRSEITESCYSA